MSSVVKLRVNVLSVLILPVISLFLSSCTFLLKEEEELAPPVKEPQKITYKTVEVKKGTLEKRIHCTGYFVSVLQKNYFFESYNGNLKDIYVKEGDRVKKGDLLAELFDDSLSREIALQELIVKKIQLNYDKIGAERKQDDKISVYDLEIAAQDVEIEKYKLNTLREDLKKRRILSTINGTVVYTKELQQGETINAYDLIVSVADPGALQLQYTNEDVSDFKLGMKAVIEIDEKTYTGEVVSISSQEASDKARNAQNSTLIRVDNLPKDTELGSYARITLILEKRENVIVLPIKSISSFEGRKFVNVLKDGIREERDVELGTQSNTEVEVVKGLDLGEQVIIG